MTIPAALAASRAVTAYADRWHRAMPGGHRVSSPLGAWLVLALAAPAATGPARAALADVLGMPVEAATATAARLLQRAHPAVAAATAAWVRRSARNPAVDAWLAGLPAAVAHGDVPTQAVADAWTDEHTLGLIRAFPLELGPQVLLVLCSALATRVSWREPYEVGPSFGTWAGQVGATLRADHEGRIVATPVGDVGVHSRRAREDLVVTSVIAPAGVADVDVLDVAHHLATGDHDWPDRSLFELPLGESPLWTITESSGERRRERVSVRLPAWEARSDLDLLAAPATGFGTAAAAVADLVAPDAPTAAKQVALARYGREGFEAAAVTVMAVTASATVPRPGWQRAAVLHFAHPFAAVATAVVRPRRLRSGGAVPHDGPHPLWDRLPVFAAWVAQAVEPAV